jgi:hypothetical protein
LSCVAFNTIMSTSSLMSVVAPLASGAHFF